LTTVVDSEVFAQYAIEIGCSVNDSEEDWRQNATQAQPQFEAAPGASTYVVDLEWLRGLDLNQRPLGYEPNELPGCSTPQS
jgi:hypothetical protein